MKYKPLEKMHQTDGSDDQSRFLYSMNDFAEREPGTLLDTVHFYWDALSGDRGDLPNVTYFDARDLFGADIPDLVSSVDVRSDDPQNYLMLDHPKSPLGPFGGQMINKRIREFPNKLHREATQKEYLICKQTRRPFYHEIDQVIGGISRHYVRVLLPLMDNSGAVVKVAVVLRRLTPSYRMFETVA